MTSALPIDVLLVEDDAGDELITREACEHNKIANRLHVVRDGVEGLEFLYRRGEHHDAPRPNLILLDLNLPTYDGRHVLETLKSDPYLQLCPGRFCVATNCMPTPTSPSRSISSST